MRLLHGAGADQLHVAFAGIESGMANPDDAAREDRLRENAEQRGMRLERSFKGDSFGSDKIKYDLLDASTNEPIIGGGSGATGLTLNEVEERLTLERFIVPPGSSFVIPAESIQISLDDTGAPQVRITEVHSSVQTWPDWLDIAFDHLKEAHEARKRLILAFAENDSDAESEALTAEFRASLQAITASVIALDGFYGAIRDMVPVPPATADERRQNQAGRAVWVADAIIRASRMPNAVRRSLTKDIHTAYRARDTAVHPRVEVGRFAHHPALPGAPVPQLYANFVVEAARGLVQMIVEAIMWVTDHPQPRNAAVTSFATTASEMLHRIVDPVITIDPNSALAQQPSDP